MEQRISLVTLGVTDLARARAFYEALGWTGARQPDDEVCFFQAGGMVFGATNAFNPGSGYDLISRLLTIVILGGLGSVVGALGAAVAMLVIEGVVAVVWSPTWSTVVFYVALVLVLSLRPAGLFGRQAARAQ